MDKKNIILIGGGGHCKSCIEVVESTNQYNIIGIIDKSDKIGESILGYKVIASDDDLEKIKKQCDFALITVGQIKSSSLRKTLYQKAKKTGFQLPIIQAATAHVSKHAEINEGTILMHHTLINANVKIGENNIINSNALIEHDVIIGNHNHISTNVVLNGDVKIGNDCFIGSNTAVVNGISIGNNVFIGISSLVTKTIELEGVYVGAPVRKIK